MPNRRIKDRDLAKLARILNLTRAKVDSDAKKLEPFVLEHFNRYVTEAVNPSLPKGYKRLPEAVQADYYPDDERNLCTHARAFVIRLPDNTEVLPGKNYRKINSLLKSYARDAPWVHKIVSSSGVHVEYKD